MLGLYRTYNRITKESLDPLCDYEIGYILIGYPRASETFITNEIYLLETLGLKLSLFSVKKPVNEPNPAVVSKIKAKVIYLPETTLLSDSNFFLWLWINLPKFMKSQLQLCKLRPRTYFQTWLETVRMSFKYRASFFSMPKKVFFKEFLQAGYIALKILESGRIRHLHAHFCHGATNIAMFVSQLCGIPFSFTAHAKDIYLSELNPGDLLQVKIRRAKFIVTCTEANRLHLDTICPEGGSLHRIYHGLDTELFVPSDRKDMNSKIPLVLSVGRFVEKKGFPYLIRACRLLKDKGYTFQCQIIGELDEQRKAVNQLIKDLGLEEVVFLHDAVTQEDLREIYRISAVFVLPCLIGGNGDRDGIPNVLVEAMAMGIPVVSTNISGIPELIGNRRNGLLVPEKDATALAEAIGELLRNPALGQRLGAAARDKVCRFFNARKNTLALKELFISCLEAGSREAE